MNLKLYMWNVELLELLTNLLILERWKFACFGGDYICLLLFGIKWQTNLVTIVPNQWLFPYENIDGTDIYLVLFGLLIKTTQKHWVAESFLNSNMFIFEVFTNNKNKISKSSHNMSVFFGRYTIYPMYQNEVCKILSNINNHVFGKYDNCFLFIFNTFFDEHFVI